MPNFRSAPSRCRLSGLKPRKPKKWETGHVRLKRRLWFCVNDIDGLFYAHPADLLEVGRTSKRFDDPVLQQRRHPLPGGNLPHLLHGGMLLDQPLVYRQEAAERGAVTLPAFDGKDGENELCISFRAESAGNIEVDARGVTRFAEDTNGRRRYLIANDAQRKRVLEVMILLASQPSSHPD